MNKILLIIIFVLAASGLLAQGNQYVVRTSVFEGDTIPLIRLREIVIFPPKVFKNKHEALRYRKLVRKIKKVLPYARIANKKLVEIEAALAQMTNERERKKYIDQKDKELKEEFEGELSKLTVSEGLLLIKLIDRETGDTSFELIKELKGSFTAFMWQSVARLFGSNLKTEYDPEGQDKLIEEIVLRIDNAQL